MPAGLTFTDQEGTATLTNGYGTAGGGAGARFRGWTPFIIPVGPVETSLGTGRRFQFAFRTDYGARFRLEEIPQSALPVALRLVAWLVSGGSVSVTTDDALGRVYAECVVAPDSEPSLNMSSESDLRYTLELALINVASPVTPMLCEYTI
ncbi:MAG: hypothetical protein KIS74_03090 [Burkholderiales bacterium]|nr:hypothetical protein [Burkholderiales bacterium]